MIFEPLVVNLIYVTSLYHLLILRFSDLIFYKFCTNSIVKLWFKFFVMLCVRTLLEILFIYDKLHVV